MELEIDENVTVAEFRIVWTESAVRCLLAFCEANLKNVGKTFALKNKTKLWQKGAEVLTAEGFEFSSAQVETKFRALERQYKKRLLNNKLTGRNRMTCPYEKELDEIFQQKKAVNPECTLGVEAIVAEGVPIDMEDSDTAMQSSSSHAVSSGNDETTIRKKKSTPDKANKILEAMAEDRRTYQEKMLALIKEKEANRERRAKEREAFLTNLLKRSD